MNNLIKKIIFFITIFFIFSGHLNATDKDRFCKVASYTFMGLIEDIEVADPKYRFGELICQAGGGGAMCSYTKTVGEGICYAGDSITMCPYAKTLGEGICYTGDSITMCPYAKNVGQGICYAGSDNITMCPYVKSIGEGICYAGGGSICSGVSLSEGICRAVGMTCPNATLEEALCKSAGLTDCSNRTFSQMLAFSIEECGIQIFSNYKPEK